MTAATNRLRHILVHLRAPVEGLADAQLLARFVTARDEAAFAALVRRHGSMVLGVCRRVLGNHADAEDAFQATFLVLARKAHAVRRRDTVGSWLYCVAHRTAQRARIMRGRRRAKECQVGPVPEPAAPPVEAHDWQPVLDEELSRLPAHYQGALVLCDLEAHPRKEAARQLGIPEGTLSSRLAKGRKLLAARLARRGITLAGGTVAAVLAGSAAAAPVPAPLVGETAKAAALVAAGQLAGVSPPVNALMKGVLTAMFMAKFKLVLGLLVGAALTVGAGTLALPPAGAQNPPAPGPVPVKPASELEALRRENELLKLNLLVVLEKVRAQEAEIHALHEARKRVITTAQATTDYRSLIYGAKQKGYTPAPIPAKAPKAADVPSIEQAMQKLRSATSDAERREAAAALEQAVQRLRAALQTKDDGQRK